jgi:alkanesulfonate monooxygenase SsuD/methylene tetrahydromethanopterin reductase-like flavin-dependent oxidoreductase (luciferase family)
MKDEFDIYGVDFHTRGKRFDEQLDSCASSGAAAWWSTTARSSTFRRSRSPPAPARTVPIFTGGVAPVALRRAAQKADGWIGAGNTPEEVPAILAEFRRLRQAAQREHVPFETIIGLSTPPDPATFRACTRRA